MKILIVPDSFKGTLSSRDVSSVIEERIRYHFGNIDIVSIPVADGGEGSVDCFLSAIGGERVTVPAENPLGEMIESFYGVLSDGRCAVIEMAAAAGLPLIEDRRDPGKASTYGVGMLISDAISRGCKDIILALGGSATNDFGCGAAAALGVKFFDKDGKTFIPTGDTLSLVERIEPIPSLGVNITVMCDVKNPVYGENGAAYVYAPQKGASPELVRVLDNGLRHISRVVKRDLGIDVANIRGAGAAGAMAGGMIAFFGATPKMGIDAVLDAVGFNKLLEGADLVFTGEGKIDLQSLEGKVIAGVATRAKERNVPVIAVVGGAEGNLSKIYDLGVTAVFTINRMPEDFSISRHKSKENLRETVDNILRILR